MSNVVRNKTTWHGKRVELMRGGKKIAGVLLTVDSKPDSDEFLFQWKDEKGMQISPVSESDIALIKEQIL